ncbi:hypothetical protein [Methanosarcina acetivorans]|uniref:hypothetical protein n=1 Tax=Methanosarcina acetivorans TaxID=2214 RepID=UPI00064F3471|nr:hypothetical protein [Methanosarcina acetivorans]
MNLYFRVENPEEPYRLFTPDIVRGKDEIHAEDLQEAYGRLQKFQNNSPLNCSRAVATDKK